MQCDYHDAGRCRSCTLMNQRYADQLADKQREVEGVLAERVPATVWDPPVRGPESGFRNKAKLVVGGRRGAPTLGILDGTGRGVDLRHCGLYEPALSRAVPVLAELVSEAGLTPYDVPTRQGELKHLLVTVSPEGELMTRFVLRSPGQLPRVRELVPRMARALPGVRVVSANLQPEHKAVLEGTEEVLLTEQQTLPMRLNGVTLHLRTGSFFQTNTVVAAALYRQVRDWVDLGAPASLWDLYCGVGGFALHCAAPGRAVLGVEVADEAVRSARLGAQDLDLAGTGGVHFLVGDAADLHRGHPAPDTVVVNPPRRGIGPGLAGWLDRSEVSSLVYSSCHAGSLARDLAAMPSWQPVRARVFDMFPQTRHHEVAVLLRRGAGRADQPSTAKAAS